VNCGGEGWIVEESGGEWGGLWRRVEESGVDFGGDVVEESVVDCGVWGGLWSVGWIVEEFDFLLTQDKLTQVVYLMNFSRAREGARAREGERARVRVRARAREGDSETD
jgi:hypothetical protein